MQTSAAIAAAAVAKERNPTAKLLIDWDNDGFPTTTTYVGGFSDLYTDTYTDSYGVPTGTSVTTTSYGTDDVSDRVESMTITRQLATDLPDEVQGMTGYSVAQLDVTLSGNPVTESDNGASFFSPFNTGSPLYGKRRRWRTVQAQIGFGSDLLTKFTGKSTSLQVDSASRTATLQALDNAETMRGAVDLPMVVKDDLTTGSSRTASGWRPNLNASWVVDFIARKSGFYASPPPRPNCKLLCTFAGSATPEVGGAPGDFIYNVVGGGPAVGPVQFTTGKFVQALNTASIGNADLTPGAGMTLDNGGEALIEGWISAATGTAHAFCQLGTSAESINFATDTANTVYIVFKRNAVLYTWNTGLTLPNGQFAYLAVHAHFTSTTATLQCRVNSSTATASMAVVSSTGFGNVTNFFLTQGTLSGGGSGVANGIYLEAWQVSNPGITTGTPTWNDGFTPNSFIMPSLNALTATVPGLDAAWDQIQQLAAAEFATALFDELGNFRYYNRNRWTTAPYTTSQRTISASDSLTAIQTSETTDQVRNHVRITASPVTLNPVAGWVWTLSDVVSVPASGSTTVTADTGTPSYNLSTSITYASTSGATGGSLYRANTARDGSGTNVSNLTFTVTVVGAQIVTIQVNNPNASVVYLVSGGGFTDPAGTPSLSLWGQPLTFGDSQQPDTTNSINKTAAEQTIDVKDTTSIGQHGEQLLELSGNPWLQDATSLSSLAGDLLARLKDPLPTLDGLTIVGDPRLQLGDRVTIVDPTLGLNGDFFITGITEPFDGSGYTQSLTVRAIT